MRRGERLIVAAGLAAVFAASVLLPHTPLMGVTLCPFKLVTGWDCLGCGLGRAFVAMSRGDVVGAWHAHALGPALYAVAAWALVRNLVLVGAFRRHGG